MERPFYLIPDEDLSPVSIGEGYKEYLLSDVIKSLGYSVQDMFPVRGYRESPGSSLWLLYIDVVLPPAVVTIPPIAILSALPEESYASLCCSDALVRYISDSPVSFSWTKLFRQDGSFLSLI